MSPGLETPPSADVDDAEGKIGSSGNDVPGEKLPVGQSEQQEQGTAATWEQLKEKLQLEVGTVLKGVDQKGVERSVTIMDINEEEGTITVRKPSGREKVYSKEVLLNDERKGRIQGFEPPTKLEIEEVETVGDGRETASAGGEGGQREVVDEMAQVVESAVQQSKENFLEQGGEVVPSIDDFMVKQRQLNELGVRLGRLKLQDIDEAAVRARVQELPADELVVRFTLMEENIRIMQAEEEARRVDVADERDNEVLDEKDFEELGEKEKNLQIDEVTEAELQEAQKALEGAEAEHPDFVNEKLRLTKEKPSKEGEIKVEAIDLQTRKVRLDQALKQINRSIEMMKDQGRRDVRTNGSYGRREIRDFENAYQVGGSIETLREGRSKLRKQLEKVKDDIYAQRELKEFYGGDEALADDMRKLGLYKDAKFYAPDGTFLFLRAIKINSQDDQIFVFENTKEERTELDFDKVVKETGTGFKLAKGWVPSTGI